MAVYVFEHEMYDESDTGDHTKSIEEKIDPREIDVKFNHRNSKILRELLLTFKNLRSDEEKLKSNGFYKMFRRYFDSDILNMPITKYNMEVITTLFPKIKTLILTLESKYDPEEFLFKSINKLKQLEILKIHVIDKFTSGFKEPIINLYELKIYNYKPNANKYMIKHILNKVMKIKSLTILGGHFQRQVSNTIRNEKLFKLSIKNTKFDQGEIENFQEIISNHNIKYLKLITTNIHEASHTEFSKFIANYLVSLPHPNLMHLSISLPKKDTKLDFNHIFQTLNKLVLLRIFFTQQKQFNDFEQLKSIIKNKKPRLQLEFIEYRNTLTEKTYTFERTNPLKITDKKISFKRKTNPYINQYKTPCSHGSHSIQMESLDALPMTLSSESDGNFDTDSTIDMNVTYAHLTMKTDSDGDSEF